MRSLAIENFRRCELEHHIENMIALLDFIDGDPDLEDGGDAEPSFGSQAIFIGDRLEEDLEFETDDYERDDAWLIGGSDA